MGLGDPMVGNGWKKKDWRVGVPGAGVPGVVTGTGLAGLVGTGLAGLVGTGLVGTGLAGLEGLGTGEVGTGDAGLMVVGAGLGKVKGAKFVGEGGAG